MSILITGMEMPKEGFVEILIRDDGTVQQTGQSYRIDGTDYYTPYVGEMPNIYMAVPDPPHGRLIDADALIEKVIAKYLEHERKGELVFAAAEIKQDIVDLISDAPTIIPAEEGET